MWYRLNCGSSPIPIGRIANRAFLLNDEEKTPSNHFHILVYGPDPRELSVAEGMSAAIPPCDEDSFSARSRFAIAYVCWKI